MWRREERLVFKAKFRTHLDAVEFVKEVAQIAESLGHHPDVEIRYDVVILTTTTHDAGNVLTPKDYRLAERVEELYTKWRERGLAVEL